MKWCICPGAALLAVSAGVLTANEEPSVTAAEVAAMKGRFEAVQRDYVKWNEEFEADLEEAEDALEVGKVRRAALPQQVGYLRFVMMLEEDLSLLAAPVDKVDEDAAPPGFSLQERRRVASLRQEIRDAERERIRAELKEGRGMHSDDDVEEDLLDDEDALDSIFDRNAGKLKRDIAEAERDLAEKRRGDDELKKNLETWNAELTAIHEYVYGFPPAAGFDREAELPEGSDAATLLAKLAAEREAVTKSLRGEEEGGEGEKKAGVVGGLFVYSANLGVVLDVSGSMTPHIPELKEEIGKTFTAPRYREVKGCRIHGTNYGALTFKGLASASPDTMSVIEELIAGWGVDTVYWFCDLRDGFDFRGLRRLRYLLLRSGATFNVKSMAMRPERELKPLIDDFEG